MERESERPESLQGEVEAQDTLQDQAGGGGDEDLVAGDGVNEGVEDLEGEDQDAGPTKTAERVEADSERDQAEG